MRCPTCGREGTELAGFGPDRRVFVCSTSSCPVTLYEAEGATGTVTEPVSRN